MRNFTFEANFKFSFWKKWNSVKKVHCSGRGSCHELLQSITRCVCLICNQTFWSFYRIRSTSLNFSGFPYIFLVSQKENRNCKLQSKQKNEMIFFICLEIMESSIEKSKSYTIVLQASKLQVTTRVGVLRTRRRHD